MKTPCLLLTFLIDGFAKESIANVVSFTFAREIAIGIRTDGLSVARRMRAFVDIYVARRTDLDHRLSSLFTIATTNTVSKKASVAFTLVGILVEVRDALSEAVARRGIARIEFRC